MKPCHGSCTKKSYDKQPKQRHESLWRSGALYFRITSYYISDAWDFHENNAGSLETELSLTGVSAKSIVTFWCVKNLNHEKNLSMLLNTGFIELNPSKFCAELRKDLMLQACRFEYLGPG